MLINKDIFNALISVNSLSEAGTEQLDCKSNAREGSLTKSKSSYDVCP